MRERSRIGAESAYRAGVVRPLLLVALAVTACEAKPHTTTAPADAGSSEISADEAALAKVTAIHGAPGPWAVLGYRMGDAALHELGLSRGSFDLLVVHHTPDKVQYSCIADGASASTGASTGKLNLKLAPASDDEVFTEYINKKTGEQLRLRPTAAFRARFTGADRAKAHEYGLQVMQLPDAELFEPSP